MQEEQKPANLWLEHRLQIESALYNAFIRYAIDNRGILTSPRRGKEVAATIFDVAQRYADKATDEEEVSAVAVQLAEQGMAMVTARHMMQTLSKTAVSAKLGNFPFIFMESLANARELLQQRQQENAQAALQRALHNQLDQQIALHDAQKKQSQNLNQILQLNARLSQAEDEETLLSEAVEGLCQALDIANVTLYEFRSQQEQWVIRTTTAGFLRAGGKIPTEIREQLYQTLNTGRETTHRYQTPDGMNGLSAVMPLRVGSQVWGVMIANHDNISAFSDDDEYLILIRTFTQNLAALWNNLYLLTQAEARTHELEILHGRFVDSLWHNEETSLQAAIENGQVAINRSPESDLPALPENSLPLSMGEHVFGHLELPESEKLSQEDRSFVSALVREMENALANAQFLQTTQAYSNQLSLAAEVSRAAATILDRDLLIQEVVNLIRDRFDFYYVGLFLVDGAGETAVLRAGTGEAGKRQIAQNHHHVIGGNSMIGAAIAQKEARVEQDVTQAAAFSRNPLLPDTKAEVALPLRSAGEIIGALTVQSVHKGAFSDQAVTVLQSLADQLAIAIENAGLFEKTQRALAESNNLFLASRQISEAKDEKGIYQALIAFAKESDLVDAAQIIVPDKASPDYLLCPEMWSRENYSFDPTHRFSRDKYLFSERLAAAETQVIYDGQTDPDIDRYTRRLFAFMDMRAANLVPIYVENEWFGTLTLLRHANTPLTEQEMKVFQTITEQAAVILANQRLLQQTDFLYRIGRALNEAITRDDALKIAVNEVKAYTGASQCRFVICDKEAGMATVTAESSEPGLGQSIQLPMLGDYVFDYLAKKREPLLLSEATPEAPAEAVRLHVHQFGAQATLLIPAASQQDLMGYLAIDSLHGKRPFTPSNIIFAQTVVDHLTIQLENVKLLDEALQRAQELITLNQIQSSISRMIDMHGLALAVYDQVGRLLDNTFFILARYNADTRTYAPILHVIDGQTVPTEARTLEPEEPLYQFLKSGQHQMLDDRSPLLRQEQTLASGKAPKSSLWVTLQHEGRAQGLISVQSADAHAYEENDIQLLRSIATQTGLTITNAELFEKIQAQNEELRQLDKIKTQFLANMSHELRTPLNSIIGFSRVILKGIDGPLTPAQEEDLNSIYNNGQHLLMLINEILDMAKIEAGKMTLAFEQLDVAETVETVRKTVLGLIEPDKIDLIWDVEPGLPLLEADPMRLRQILLNLLSNAAKYTEKGEIHLQITEEEGRLHISVRDTGIGVAPEDQDKLFKAFEQVDSSTTRAVGGTGLGLPITKWLVHMHQGSIFFESELNQGTTFHVLLPLRQDDENAHDIPLSESPVGLMPQQAQQPNRID